jgi:hypothetical protein
MSIPLNLITNRISFEAHVATVRDYLNWTRQRSNFSNRDDGSRKFSEYIISACWPKMKRRIGHWAAVGMMYCLMEVADVRMEEMLNNRPFSTDSTHKRSDRKLSQCLVALSKTQNLEDILTSYGSLDANPTKPKDVLPCLLRQCSESPSDIYKKETVIEFHHFFVATLLCYAKSLQDLHVQQKKKEEEDNLLESVINKLVNSISYHQKRVATSTTKKGRRARDSNTRMPTFKSFGTEVADDLVESREGKKMELETLPDGELTKALSSEGLGKEEKKFLPELKILDGELIKALSLEGKEEEEILKEEEKILPKLKSILLRKLNRTPSSPAEPTRHSENLKILQQYLDEKLSAITVTPKATVTDPIFESKAHSICFILHKLLVSAAFHHHIKFLVYSEFDLLPSDSRWNLKAYNEFSELHGLPQPQSLSQSENKANDGNHGSRLEGIAADDVDNEDLERDQAPFGFLEKEEMVLAVQGWVKLFVQHFHAKSILESFAWQGDPDKDVPIDIRVYGVGRPKENLALPDKETLVRILNSSITDSNFSDEEREEIIELFFSKVKSQEFENLRVSNKGRNIINIVNSIANGEAKTGGVFYNMHCEAALAGLVASSRFYSGEALSRYADKKLVDDLNVCLGVPPILQPR